MRDDSQASDQALCAPVNSLPQPEFRGGRLRRSGACDPLGLTERQRQLSDQSETMGEWWTAVTEACPLCRAYECLSSCFGRQIEAASQAFDLHKRDRHDSSSAGKFESVQNRRSEA